MLRDYRCQLDELKASQASSAAATGPSSAMGHANEHRTLSDTRRTGAGGSENVDPGSRSGASGSRYAIRGIPAGRRNGQGGGSGGVGKKEGSSVDVDTLEGQRAVLEALVQETEKV